MLLASTVIILIFLGFVIFNSQESQPKVEGMSTSWLFSGIRGSKTVTTASVSGSVIESKLTETSADAGNLDLSLNDKTINVMATGHTRADQEITRRINALNNLITRINAMVKVSDSQKSALTSQVQAIIANLQSLKTKIDADTNPATLLADKKSIVVAYRVFVFMIPKVTIISNADKILDLAALLQAKNPSTAAAAKISDAITQANNAISTVSALDPSGWPGNRAALVSARQMLKTALGDLRSAWTIMKAATPTATP